MTAEQTEMRDQRRPTWHVRNRDKIAHKVRARQALMAKVRSGKIVRPDTCQLCGQQPPRGRDGRSRIQAHHHRGYEFPFDVQWLCSACHEQEHRHEKLARPMSNRTPEGFLRAVEMGIRVIRGQSAADVARDFGVSRTLIQEIKAGRCYAGAFDAAKKACAALTGMEKS